MVYITANQCSRAFQKMWKKSTCIDAETSKEAT